MIRFHTFASSDWLRPGSENVMTAANDLECCYLKAIDLLASTVHRQISPPSQFVNIHGLYFLASSLVKYLRIVNP